MLILYMDRKIQSLQGPQRTKNKLILKGILKLDFLIESYFLKKNYSLYFMSSGIVRHLFLLSSQYLSSRS